MQKGNVFAVQGEIDRLIRVWCETDDGKGDIGARQTRPHTENPWVLDSRSSLVIWSAFGTLADRIVVVVDRVSGGERV